jgi:hypothetical protein
LGTGLSLDLSVEWPELVKEPRNAFHCGQQPQLLSNYEKVATLMLAGAKHLRNLYALYHAAIAHRSHRQIG